MNDIKRVGVLGCGLMGSGIAQVAASAGYETSVRDVSKEFLDRGRGGIEKSLAKFVEKGKLQAADRDATLKRLTFTTSVSPWALSPDWASFTTPRTGRVPAGVPSVRQSVIR